MQQATASGTHPLATEPVGKLLRKFAIPAIISGLVSSLYNIVDQIFIGHSIGMLGNAATNVAFPIVIICTALALLFGVGSASNFSLSMGAGNKERGGDIVGTGIFCLAASGILLASIVLLFLQPLLLFFGATSQSLPHALTYSGITALGIPFLLFAVGGSHIVRADGSPRFAMLSILSGAVLNTVLDPILIFVLDMGMAGAAWATVIGQVVSGLLVAAYLFHFKTVPLTKERLRPKLSLLAPIAALGAAAWFNQMSMFVVQIVLNKTLTHYGALSSYGEDIPLACVGVISKVNQIYIAFVIGISQGSQPIIGFNYGAGNYARVRETLVTAIKIVLALSTVAFLSFQLLPRQITALFGDGSEVYFRFAERYFRIFFMMIIFNGLQPLIANFFSNIGKAKMGVFMALTRQILFLLPLIVILPLLFGIDGVMYAGPIADSAALILSVFFIFQEFKHMTLLEQNALHSR